MSAQEFDVIVYGATGFTGRLVAEHLLKSYGAGGDTRSRLARRGTAAAAMVAKAVFHLIGVVGVAGAVLPGDVAIVLGALVDILDQHGDRRAGGDERIAVLDHAGEDLHLVGLAPLGDEAGLAGTTAVELLLDVLAREADAGRAAVDHAAERRPVALAPGGDAEEVAEAVEHGPSVSRALSAARPGREDAACGARVSCMPDAGHMIDITRLPARVNPVARICGRRTRTLRSPLLV